MKPVETDELTIHYDAARCVHSRHCILGLPGVFLEGERPWIRPAGASTAAIVKAIEACPSGALTYQRKDGAGEAAPAVNTIRVWENGPLEVRGDLRLGGREMRRALLCRCGKTARPPFCDNSHRKGFGATGLPGFNEKKDHEPEGAGGPLVIEPEEHGSNRITGNAEVIGSDGQRVARVKKAWFCRCGASGAKPFCDSSHKLIGFTKAVE